MPNNITVCGELSERYEYAQQLAMKISDIREYGDEEQYFRLIDGVQSMLENGCFCPDCLDMYLGEIWCQQSA